MNTARFRESFEPLRAFGANPATGGLNRFAWTPADGDARAWFVAEAERLTADHVEVDNNGNQWAWWGDPAAGNAVVTGSHLDTVPEGGAYDGALGVVSGFLAVETVRERGVRLMKPVAVVAFADEEGARFGVPCVGSRLLAGSLPAGAFGGTDRGGVTMAAAMLAAGVDATKAGPDPNRLGRLGCLVELHVEQGRQLGRIGAPVGIATEIWPHGRWRLLLKGEANHAGTTLLDDRRDPMQVFAVAIETARNLAVAYKALATIGRVAAHPNGTNVIASEVACWLDARAPSDQALDSLVDGFQMSVGAAGRAEGVEVSVTLESRSHAVVFARKLLERHRLPSVPTGAGHDAGVLAGLLPTAMLFVRNPTGVSHSPAERATDADCVAGIETLATVLVDLAGA